MRVTRDTKDTDRPMLLTGLAAAKHLGVATPTLRRWTRQGLVPIVRDPLTGTIRYSLPALDRWLADNCPPVERAS